MYALGASARIVLQDTMLQSRWLLKKDSYIFMPNRATHFDTASWGPGANTFDAQRFEHIKSGCDKVTPGAFQGFGGGQNSCPGRHFAMMQIVALVAMMAPRFFGAAIWKGADQYTTNTTENLHTSRPSLSVSLPFDLPDLLSGRATCVVPVVLFAPLALVISGISTFSVFPFPDCLDDVGF